MRYGPVACEVAPIPSCFSLSLSASACGEPDTLKTCFPLALVLVNGRAFAGSGLVVPPHQLDGHLAGPFLAPPRSQTLCLVYVPDVVLESSQYRRDVVRVGAREGEAAADIDRLSRARGAGRRRQ